MFKRLKNIENKVKGKNKKELEPTKNKKQLEVRKDEPTVADKKPTKIVLLKDKLDFIFKNFGSNFNNTGKKILIKHAKDKKRLIIIIFFLKQIVSLFLKVLIFQKKLTHCMIY